MAQNFTLELKAGDIDTSVSISRRPNITDVSSLTKRIFTYMGAAVRDAGKALDYLDSCDKIDIKLSCDGRVESEVFESVDDMFAGISTMVDNVIIVE